MSKTRECAHCHADLFRKTTWESWCAPNRRTVSRWLCMTCGQTHTFTIDGQVKEKQPRAPTA
jgi:RNase P subunit RPR2